MPSNWARKLGPSGMLLGSFGGLIVLGAAVLALPVMQGANAVSLVDCLFTSTSAVCVTGLITVDTTTAWSGWGQGTILVLIQLGGLGIMTFSVALLELAGKQAGLLSHRALAGSVGGMPGHDTGHLVKRILAYTLVLEGAGAFILFLRFWGDYPAGTAAALGVFHAVSAFCNAGFSLFSDSLAGYTGDLTVNLTVISLIILGGLGFVVLRELAKRARERGRAPRRRWPLHTQLVLITTAVLVLGGWVGIWLCEGLTGGGWARGLLPALFTSVTARTAGFNTVSMGQLSNPSLLLVMVLMFVGASPGGTGGGIKTTCLATLFALSRGRLAGGQAPGLRGRSISLNQVGEALTLLLGSLLVVALGTLILVTLEVGDPALGHQRGDVMVQAFEAVSAFATVGLSMGATAGLSWAGKLVIISLMFIGRLGPLTFIYALTQRRRRPAYRRASERIMLG